MRKNNQDAPRWRNTEQMVRPREASLKQKGLQGCRASACPAAFLPVTLLVVMATEAALRVYEVWLNQKRRNWIEKIGPLITGLIPAGLALRFS